MRLSVPQHCHQHPGSRVAARTELIVRCAARTQVSARDRQALKVRSDTSSFIDDLHNGLEALFERPVISIAIYLGRDARPGVAMGPPLAERPSWHLEVRASC